MSKKQTDIDVKRETTTTPPARTEGWAPLMTLRDDFDRLFDEFGAGMWRWPLPRRAVEAFPAMRDWVRAPAMDMIDSDGAYRLTAELPGMTPDDIDVTVTDMSLTIRGEKTEETKDEKDNYLLSERRFGSFQRTLPLPEGVNAEAIAAEFASGVLTITLPKTAEAKQKQRKVEVKAA